MFGHGSAPNCRSIIARTPPLFGAADGVIGRLDRFARDLIQQEHIGELAAAPVARQNIHGAGPLMARHEAVGAAQRANSRHTPYLDLQPYHDAPRIHGSKSPMLRHHRQTSL